MVDLSRDTYGNVHARLLDLVSGRSGRAYKDWLKERGTAFTSGVKIATLDPFHGDKNAIDDELEDAVDIISSSGYYPTGTWDEHLARIKAVVDAHGQEFVFLEAGCPSRDTSPARPNDWGLAGEPDEGAQADYLEEMLSAIDAADWVLGVALWDWPPTLYALSEAATNDDYCMYGKRGAAVVAEHFSRSCAHGTE
jgi:hypothetical protein